MVPCNSRLLWGFLRGENCKKRYLVYILYQVYEYIDSMVTASQAQSSRRYRGIIYIERVCVRLAIDVKTCATRRSQHGHDYSHCFC